MAYRGQIINIPLGELGLFTDDAQTITPPQGLIRAENVEIKHGYLEKTPGSKRWNKTALPSGVAQFFDWWPDENTQRAIVVTKDGRVWRFTDQYHYTEVLPENDAPANLRVSSQVVMVGAGQEEAGNPRKLFIFTGNDPVQVISGDGTTRHNMTHPAADWSGSFYPSFGIPFQNRLYCFGNRNQPHFLYGSSPTDHEDFVTLGSAVFANVFPGDSERLISAANYKGQLVLFKYPFGFYLLNVDDPSAPFPQKMGSSFGAGSGLGSIQVLDDLWIGNSTGSITSLNATNSLGGMQQSDVVKSMKCYKYLQEHVAPIKNFSQQAIWYEAKKLALFSFHSPSSAKPDRIFTIDLQSSRPRPTMNTKDQPNCLGLMKDTVRIDRPFYGAEDGYIYAMDQKNRNVADNAYEMSFQTPFLDFSFVDRRLADVNKNFDFLEVKFEPMGNWDLLADVFIDNRFVETVKFNMAQQDVLDNNFRLDQSRASGPGARNALRPIHGMGRQISVRFYNAEKNHNARIQSVTFYFRPSGQQQRSS